MAIVDKIAEWNNESIDDAVQKHKVKITKRDIRHAKKESKEVEKTGIWIGELRNADTEKEKNISKTLLYLSNAVINFLVVYGTIGCVLGSMEIEWNDILIGVILVCMAMYMSTFYQRKLQKILGYAMIIVLLIYGLRMYILELRTGFALIMNKIMAVIQRTLHLPIEREYETYTENTSFAIAICIILLACAFMLLMNIIISELKNCYIVLLFTFPVTQLPIYLEKELPLVYFAMYMAGIFALYIIRSGGHYGVHDKKKGDYGHYKWRKKRYYSYRTDGEGNACVVACILLISLFTAGIFAGLYSYEKYTEKGVFKSAWKESTEDIAKRFALVGFSGMLANNRAATGGVGTGKLGQVGIVRNDYETDLIIETRKEALENQMYIRCYSSDIYKDNEWLIEKENKADTFCSHYQPADEFVTYDAANTKLLATYSKSMRICNLSDIDSFAFIPYYNTVRTNDKRLLLSEDQDMDYVGGLYNHTIREIKEYVKSVRERAVGDEDFTTICKREESYRKKVYDRYLGIAAWQKDKLLKLCKEHGIEAGSENAVEGVVQLLRDNYMYSLMPGITPDGEDFVDYFLFEQKKGYCTYFASAAVLMFRSLGIPARYVSGYAVPKDAFDDADLMDSFTEIYGVNVTDEYAHAWPEVYIDGFGWYPVEVTLAEEIEEEEDEDMQNIQRIFNDFFGPQAAARLKSSLKNALSMLALMILAFVILYIVVGIIVRALRDKRFKKRGDNETVCRMFEYLKKIGVSSKSYTGKMCSHRDTGNMLAAICDGRKEQIEELVFLMEKARYSGRGLTEEEYGRCYEITRELATGMKAGMSAGRRWYVRFVKWL